MLKLQKFVINKPENVRHWRRAAIQQLCQHRLQQASLYLQHTMTSALQVTTSKEYSTIDHILSKYFELATSGKNFVKLIIIWLNYEKKKKRAILWNTVYLKLNIIWFK